MEPREHGVRQASICRKEELVKYAMTGASESNSESKARVSTMTTWSEHREECQSSP